MAVSPAAAPVDEQHVGQAQPRPSAHRPKHYCLKPPDGLGQRGELAQHGVETDPETLHVLRFEFVPDDRLRKAMTAGWPGESAAAPSSRR